MSDLLRKTLEDAKEIYSELNICGFAEEIANINKLLETKTYEQMLESLTENQWFGYYPCIEEPFCFNQDDSKIVTSFNGKTMQEAYEKMVKFNKESEIN